MKKKSFWRRFFKIRRRKKKSKTGLTVRPAPKKHMTEPDFWKPPFEAKKASARKAKNQDLTVVNELTDFDLGKVTATMGIMLQVKLDYTFKLFVDECLERFKNLDWGGVNDAERHVNERGVATRTGVIYGIYTDLSSGTQIWIATNFDNGITKICLSDER